MGQCVRRRIPCRRACNGPRGTDDRETCTTVYAPLSSHKDHCLARRHSAALIFQGLARDDVDDDAIVVVVVACQQL